MLMRLCIRDINKYLYTHTHVTPISEKKEAINLKGSQRGIWKSVRGRNVRGK